MDDFIQDITIIRPPSPDTMSTGRIINIDTVNRNFRIIRDGNLSSIIHFNVPSNSVVFNRFGRPMSFARLIPGLQVRVRHASFMTASIPPQTTAFEIRVI